VCCVDLRKHFERQPLSVRVQLAATVQMQCLPPAGLPPPEVCLLPLRCFISPQNGSKK